MNKKDIEEFKKEKEYEDEQKLMNRIHENCKAANDEYKMNKQLKVIEVKKRKQRKSKRLAYALCAIFAIALVALAFKYTDSQVSSCVKAGNSTSFCENNLR